MRPPTRRLANPLKGRRAARPPRRFALAATINYIGAPNGMIPCVAITKPGGRM